MSIAGIVPILKIRSGTEPTIRLNCTTDFTERLTGGLTGRALMKRLKLECENGVQIRKRKARGPYHKLTKEQKEKILELRKSKQWDAVSIGKEMGVSGASISAVLRNAGVYSGRIKRIKFPIRGFVWSMNQALYNIGVYKCCLCHMWKDKEEMVKYQNYKSRPIYCKGCRGKREEKWRLILDEINERIHDIG